MIKKKIMDQRGFTLIELIIGFAIISIIAVMMMSYFSNGLRMVSFADKNYKANQETSIAAYKIGELVKHASSVSLTSKPGYTKLDVTLMYPGVSNVQYALVKEGSQYLLKYTLGHTDGYSTESKTLLSNVKTATLGNSTTVWYLSSAVALTLPAISVDTGTGSIFDGEGGSTVFTIDTLNIANGQKLNVAFNGPHSGLSLSTSQPTVNTNSATFTVTGTASVSSGSYPFTITYTGADAATGMVIVGVKAPSIQVELDTTVLQGSAFNALTGVKVLSASGTDITGTSTVVVGGDTVNTANLGEYNVTYNCTVSSVPAPQVDRTVKVVAAGVDVTVTDLNFSLTAPAKNESPQTTVSNAQMSGTVVWSPTMPAGKFQNNVVYTATITVTPKTGYKLAGVGVNVFKINGDSGTNAANSGVITYNKFPKAK